MKNTPSPWEVETPNHPSEPIRIIHHEDHPQGNLTICHVNPHLNDESKANARLIASAPDLLSALETLASRMIENPDGLELYGDWVAMAEAAIAKAKGEA